jgi:hypothetical protein
LNYSTQSDPTLLAAPGLHSLAARQNQKQLLISKT